MAYLSSSICAEIVSCENSSAWLLSGVTMETWKGNDTVEHSFHALIAKHIDVALFTGFISFNFCLSNLVGSIGYNGWYMENLNNIILFTGTSGLPSANFIGDWLPLYYCELRIVWSQYLLTHVWPWYYGKYTLYAENG